MERYCDRIMEQYEIQIQINFYVYKIFLKGYTRNGESSSQGKASGNRSDRNLIFTVYVFVFFSKRKRIKAKRPQRLGILTRDQKASSWDMALCFFLVDAPCLRQSTYLMIPWCPVAVYSAIVFSEYHKQMHAWVLTSSYTNCMKS